MKPLSEYIKYRKDLKYYDFDGNSGDCYDLGYFLHTFILKFPACNFNEEDFKLIYDILKITESGDRTKSGDRDEEKIEKIKEYTICNWQKFYTFFLYVMDSKCCLHHECNIGWNWDKNFKEALEIWHDDYEKQKNYSDVHKENS